MKEVDMHKVFIAVVIATFMVACAGTNNVNETDTTGGLEAGMDAVGDSSVPDDVHEVDSIMDNGVQVDQGGRDVDKQKPVLASFVVQDAQGHKVNVTNSQDLTFVFGVKNADTVQVASDADSRDIQLKTCKQQGDLFYCQFDLGEISNQTNGQVSIQARAKQGDMLSAPLEYTFTMDTTEPNLLTTDFEPDHAKNGSKVDLTLTIDKAIRDAKVTCDVVDFKQISLKNNTVVFEGWIKCADKSKDVRVAFDAHDLAGNDVAGEVGGLTVDNQPPEASNIVLSKQVVGLGQAFSMDFDVSEPLSKTPIMIIDNSMGQCTTQDTLSYRCTYTTSSKDSDGVKTIKLLLTDVVGNFAQINAGTITFDLSPDGITNVTVQPETAKQGDHVVVDVTFDKSTVISRCYAATMNFSCTSQSDTEFTCEHVVGKPDPEGRAEVVFEVRDLSGNSVVLRSGAFFTVDMTSPVPDNIRVTPEYLAKGGNINVQFTASEPLSTTDFEAIAGKSSVNSFTTRTDGSKTTYVVSIPVDPTDTEGSKDVSVRIADKAGNENRFVAGQVVYDFTAPTVTGSFDKSFATNGSVVTDTVVFSEQVKDFKYQSKLDFNCTSTDNQTFECKHTVAQSDTEGQYDLAVSAVDLAGNPMENAPVRVGSFTVDRTPPTIQNINLSPVTAKAGTILTLTFDTDEALSALPQVKVGGVSFETCEDTSSDSKMTSFKCSHQVTSTETPGTHIVSIRITDMAGNETRVDAGTVTYDFSASN